MIALGGSDYMKWVLKPLPSIGAEIILDAEAR